VSEIGLIGLWHLGSVAAGAWTLEGHRVTAWDPDQQLRASIAAGQVPIAEPGLNAALTSAVERGRLQIADDVSVALERADVVHVAYDTLVESSGAPSDPRLDEAIRLFAASARAGALLLVSSQLAVGTCDGWRILLEGEGRGLLLAHVPENLRLGSALEDFRRPSRLLIGADDDNAFERAAELFALAGTPPMRLRLASAEMAKHATNAYLAVCIAFGNDLAWLSLCAGADPTEVAAALRADPRVSPSAPLRPGGAFSGATLTRDLKALQALGERFERPDLFTAVLATNDRHALLPLRWLQDELGSLSGMRIAVAGLTYKPGTSTLRDSLPLRIVSRLLEDRAVVTAWDPAAEPFELPRGMLRTSSLEACVQGADALAVLTALPELEEVDWRSLRPDRRIVVDGCGGVDRRAVESAGWIYRGITEGRAPAR
jgi:UDPglucose 6-dehydrogenase